MTRRSYSGTARATTLSAGINASDTSLSVIDATGWPSSTFIATLERGTVSEEKILVGTRSSNSFSGITRAFDGTTATTHASGVAVEHTFSKTDADEANRHINDTAQSETEHSTLHNAARHALVSHTTAMIGDSQVTTAKVADGAITDPKLAAALPRGTLGYASTTGSQSVSSQVDLTGLSVSVTAGSGRRIKVTGRVGWTSTVADDGLQVLIQEDGSSVGTGISYGPQATNGVTTIAQTVRTPSSGSHTYKLRGLRVGSGTLTVSGSPYPNFILVEDIGSA